jgi:hypothetical protein
MKINVTNSWIIILNTDIKYYSVYMSSNKYYIR